MNASHTQSLAIYAVMVSALSAVALAADAQPSIRPPTRENIRDRLVAALGKDAADWKTEAAILDSPDNPILDATVACIAKAQPDVAALMKKSSSPETAVEAVQFASDAARDVFLRANVGLAIARDYSRSGYLDESIAVLEAVSRDDVVDPATYYFYIAAGQFQLQKRKPALDALQKLAQVADAPIRYRKLAEMMDETLRPMEREKLGGIAHDMRDVRRRLDNDRTDEKVQGIEKDIIDRLDKVVDDLEKQAKKVRMRGSKGGAQKPADDSRIMEAKGEGKVGNRTFNNKGNWGNLPDKQRERVMQELGREFPAHYREAVEEYFKRLADEKSRK